MLISHYELTLHNSLQHFICFYCIQLFLESCRFYCDLFHYPLHFMAVNNRLLIMPVYLAYVCIVGSFDLFNLRKLTNHCLLLDRKKGCQILFVSHIKRLMIVWCMTNIRLPCEIALIPAFYMHSIARTHARTLTNCTNTSYQWYNAPCHWHA